MCKKVSGGQLDNVSAKNRVKIAILVTKILQFMVLIYFYLFLNFNELVYLCLTLKFVCINIDTYFTFFDI